MLTEYINAALKHAKYEYLQEDKCFYGEIPVCNGVWASSDNIENCRKELIEVLEEWLLFRIHEDMSLPEIDGLTLKIKDVA